MSEFKVGDLITSPITCSILEVVGFGHGNFIKAKALSKNHQNIIEGNFLSFQVKHATLAEIKAGRRL